MDWKMGTGYHLNRRDGLRYPSYVRLDSEGRRIRNDKFIVTQQGKCCFKPQQQKSYNIISFIKEHPHFFAEYHAGVSPDRLVNLVCNRLLNHPVADRDTRIIQPKRDVKPFDMADYLSLIHIYKRPLVDRNNKPYRDFARYGLAYNSVYVIAYHVFIVDKQIIVAVATIPVFFAESSRHISIFAWLTP